MRSHRNPCSVIIARLCYVRTRGCLGDGQCSRRERTADFSDATSSVVDLYIIGASGRHVLIASRMTQQRRGSHPQGGEGIEFPGSHTTYLGKCPFTMRWPLRIPPTHCIIARESLRLLVLGFAVMTQTPRMTRTRYSRTLLTYICTTVYHDTDATGCTHVAPPWPALAVAKRQGKVLQCASPRPGSRGGGKRDVTLRHGADQDEADTAACELGRKL